MVPLRNRFFQSSSLHLYAILIRSRGEQVWHTSLRMSSTWCKNYGAETMIGFSIVEKSRLLVVLPMSILFRRVMPKKWSGMNWTICWGKWRKSVTLRTRKWYDVSFSLDENPEKGTVPVCEKVKGNHERKSWVQTDLKYKWELDDAQPLKERRD